MKRVLCLVSSLLLTLFFVGCHTVTPPASDTTPTDPDGTTVTPPETLCLAYNREDTLDPFSASTQLNLCLSSLLYEPLLRPGADFAPVLVLAQSAEQTDSTHIAVTLRKGAAFSDGTAVTADDVIFSFNKAKASANYKVALANVQSASAKRGVITFTLSSADPNGSYNLYFPIIKRSTDTSAAATAAVGSGPYVFNADGQKLTANAKNAAGAAAQNKEIQLLSLMDNDAVLQNLEKGSIHYMFNDLSSGDIPRTSAKDTAVDLPQLVYLGVNSSRAALAAPAVRQALSAAIDRTALAASSYAGRALPATTPFHPKWKPAVGLSAFSAGSEAGKVNALLQAAQTVPTTTAATGAAGANGKDGVCAGFFSATGELLNVNWGTPLSFTNIKSEGGLIAYNTSEITITLKKGHAYSLVFSGTVTVSAKGDDKKCGVSLTDGYDTSGAMFFATQTYTVLAKKDLTARLTVAYNTVYTATDDITLKLAYNNMLLQDTNFGDSRYSVTITALN